MSSRLNRLPFLLLLLPAVVSGVEELTFSIARISGEGLTASGLEVALAPLPDNRARLELRIGHLELAAADRVIESVELSCPEARVSSVEVSCEKGSLLLPPPWAKGPSELAFSWTTAGRLKLQLTGLSIADGRLDLTLGRDGPADPWAVKVQGKDFSVTALAALLRLKLDKAGWRGSGRLDLRATLRLDATGLLAVDWQLHPHQLDFTAPAGLGLQGNAIDASWKGRVERGAQGALHGKVALEMRAGGVLGRLFYLGPAGESLRLESALSLDADRRNLVLEGLRFHHPGVLTVEGGARIALQPFAVDRLQLKTGKVRGELLYDQYLRGTALEGFVLKGGLQAAVELESEERARLVLDLDDFDLEDSTDPAVNLSGGQRYALRGIGGRLIWTRGREAEPSRLSWREGHLLENLAFGAAALEARLQERELKLLKGLDLPVLDGHLLVERLELAQEPEGPPQLTFDAVITPISMQDLSRALGWPELSGSLSGVIPGLAYKKGVLTVDGNLLIRVFDGSVVIRRLRLSDLFGVLPTLAADVEIDNLDLETLTRTFSFGKITGRLDGRVDRLYLEGWQPVSFDAGFATPAGDESSHTINQRAVDNISNLGGAGIGGALSRSFLGLFESFHYARLGISCRLKDGICHMGGVEPAEQGYYLVVGSGIPQINIVGFTTETDWNRLVEQLQQIEAGGSPVVE